MNTGPAFALQQIVLRSAKLELLNTYRGVPIVYPAIPEKVDEASLTVKVSGHQIICLALEPMTILLSPLLEDPVHADVLACDVGLGQATLGNFQYTHARVGDRTVARVAPQAPVTVKVIFGEHTLTGQLADISMVGLGATVPSAEAVQLRSGSAVTVLLTLPIEPKTELRLAGTVRSIRPDSGLSEHNRIGIQFASQSRPGILHRYIRERQEEIDLELKALYAQRISEER
ncbi:MAG: PilZ domain-containing protein [Anaerolineales bacterium]|nr:PilZ domain-containing protein [Anaerolineales bacterium]